MKNWQRLILLIINMTAVSLIVGGVAIFLLYRAAIEQVKDRLQDLAKNQASLIESMYSNQCNTEKQLSKCEDQIIETLIHARNKFKGLGKTGEFAIAERRGEKIIYLLHRYAQGLDSSNLTPDKRNFGEPMRKALSGQSGIMIALDYRGVEVLAAYEPVANLHWGVVAKADIKEIQTPFIKAGIYTVITALIVDLLGAILFLRLSNPLIKKLETSEKRYATLTEISPVGIFHTDPQGDCLYVNERWCKIAGLTQKEAFGQGWVQAVHIEDRAKVYNEWYTATQSNIPFSLEYRFQSPEGRITWVYGQAVAQKDNQGEIVGYVGTITDITPKHTAEEKLKAINENLEDWIEQQTAEQRQELELIRRIMETSPVGILVFNPQGKITLSNDEAEQILGLSKDTLMRIFYNSPEWNLTDYEGNIISPEMFPFAVVMKTGESLYNFPCILTKENQERVLLNINAASLWDEMTIFKGVILTLEDVTEKVQFEQEKLKTEAVFRVIFENTMLGIGLVSKEGKPLQANPALQKMLGYSSEELSQMTFSQFTHSEDIDTDLARLDDLIAGKIDTYEMEKRYICKNGKIIWGHLNVSPIRNQQGELEFVIGIVEDITSKKQAETSQSALIRRYQSIIQALGEIVYEHSVLEDIIHWQGNYTQLLGYSSEEMGTDSNSWLSRVHPDDLIGVLAEFERAWDEDRFYDQEYRLLHRDGSYRWIHSRGVMYGESDKPEQVIGVMLDITERKQSEEILRATKHQLEVILETISDGVSVLDAEGQLIYVNQAMAEMTGYVSPREMLENWTPIKLLEKFDLEDELGQPLQVEQLPSYQALQGIKSAPTVINYRLKNKGIDHWNVTQATPVFDEQGQVKLVVIVTHNISQLKRVELALRESEERYRRIIETANEGIWMIDADNKTSFVNEIMAEMLGYSVGEMLGSSLFEFMDSQGRAIASKNVERRSQGIREHHDFKFLKKNGGELWAMLSTSPVLDDQGNYQGALALIMDITERKHMEQALQESEAKFRALLNAITEGVFLMDMNGHVLAANETLAKRLGTNLEQLLGACIYDFLPPEIVQIRRQYVNQVIRTGQPFYTEDVRSGRQIGNSLYPIFDERGQVVSLAVFGQDITQAKEAQAALQESETRFRQLVENIPQIFWIISADGQQVLYVSPAYETITGYKCEKLYQLGVDAWLEIIHPEDRSKVEQAYEKMLREGIFAEQYRVICADGSIRYISDQSAPIRNQDGHILRHIGLAEDVTEQKQTAEALEKANLQLTNWIAYLEQQHQEMVWLDQLNDFLQACLTLEEAHHTLGDLLKPLFPGSEGGVFISNASDDLLQVVATWGTILNSETVFHPKQCWALRRGHIHYVKQTQPTLFCSHIHTDPLPVESLCVPMMAQGTTLGLLYISSAKNGVLTDNKQKLARSVSEQLALALGNLKLREELRNQSIRDILTGLYNRRYLEESLLREIHSANRKKYSVGVIMMDVDHFKDFNDNYGHDLGDAVLRELGSYLRNNIRASDIACRYGGEELTLIMPDASLEDAQKRAEYLKEGIKLIRVYYRGQINKQITASFGVACFPEHGKTPDVLLHAADTALLQAKQQGRDRVVVCQTQKN